MRMTVTGPGDAGGAGAHSKALIAQHLDKISKILGKNVSTFFKNTSEIILLLY